MESSRSCRLAPIYIIASVIAASGCASDEPGPAKPPPVAAANDALVATLQAWKSGLRDTGRFLGSSPAVGIVDSLRRLRPLIDYEVVGPLGAVDNARPFAVRLVLDAPAETITTRYLVVGQDPLWVFLQEDYELILHWEHKMTDEEPGSTPGAVTAETGTTLD